MGENIQPDIPLKYIDKGLEGAPDNPFKWMMSRAEVLRTAYDTAVAEDKKVCVNWQGRVFSVDPAFQVDFVSGADGYEDVLETLKSEVASLLQG